MATNKISLLIDVTVDKANSALKSFRQSITDADGTVGKFKAGASVAFDNVKANAGAFAAAAGASLVAFGAKAVESFTDAALAAGSFADATKMSVEDSSRWLDVASRYGIELGDLSDAFNNVAGKVAEGDQVFSDLGVTFTKTETGAVDMNATMRDVVESIAAIEDPAEKARVASKLLGEEGSRQFAELTGEAGRLTDQLANVAEAKIIDEDEVRKAREYRDAMRELNQVVGDISMKVGEILTPVIADAAEIIAKLTGGVEAADEATGGWLSKLGPANNAFSITMGLWDKGPGALIAMASSEDEAAEATDRFATNVLELNEAQGDNISATDRAAASNEDLAKAADEAHDQIVANALALDDHMSKADLAAAKLDHLGRRYDALKGVLSDKRAFLDIQDGFDTVERAAIEAYDAAQKGSADAESKARDYERAVIDQKLRIAEYIEGLGKIPPDKLTSINAAIDKGDYDLAEYALAMLARQRVATITPAVGAAKAALSTAGGGGKGTMIAGATGGIVRRPTWALIGEAGPEAVVPLNKTPGNGPLPTGGLGGGGVVLNINVTAGLGVNGGDVGRQVADVLRPYFRNGGPSF